MRQIVMISLLCISTFAFAQNTNPINTQSADDFKSAFLADTKVTENNALSKEEIAKTAAGSSCTTIIWNGFILEICQ